MCLRCEGRSDDEVNALLDERIRTHGWTTMGVDGGLPDSEFCRCHAGSQPPLHLAHVLFGTSGPKRAERRRTARRRRGSA